MLRDAKERERIGGSVGGSLYIYKYLNGNYLQQYKDIKRCYIDIYRSSVALFFRINIYLFLYILFNTLFLYCSKNVNKNSKKDNDFVFFSPYLCVSLKGQKYAAPYRCKLCVHYINNKFYSYGNEKDTNREN